MAGGWNRFPDGQWKFNLGTLSGVPAGDYSLAPEFASSEGVFSTGYGQEVLIRDTPTGKKLAVKKVGEN
jgi:hypothetical protein